MTRTKSETKVSEQTLTKIAFSIEQISEMTTLSKGFLRKEIHEGRLKARRFGRRVLILNDPDLARYLGVSAVREGT
jgi:excisionase family DNA binding protein